MKSQIKNTKNNFEIFFLLKCLWCFFSRRRKIQFFIILILMLLSGVAEMISFTAVIPFLTVLTEPERLFEIEKIRMFLDLIKVDSSSQLLLFISIIFIIVSIIAAFVKLSTIWITGRFAALIGSEISVASFSKSLMQPYFVHTERKTSSIISTNTNNLNAAVLVIHTSLWFISNFIISVLILIGLFIVNFKIALTLFFIFSSAYAFLMLTAKSRLVRNSDFITIANQKQVKTIQESFGSIRDIILDKSYKTFIDLYKNIDITSRLKNAENIFLSIYPRNLLEIIGIIFIVVIALIMNSNMQFSLKEILPILGAFALGAQRLLPAMQQSYNAWATINAYSYELLDVINSINQKVEINIDQSRNFYKKEIKKFFMKKISFKSVSFRYSKTDNFIIKNFNLDINKGDKIGIVGTTGCGKSTLIDLLMGLLIPSNGEIYVDGKNINLRKNIEKWRSNITHVPQNIFLTDNSFAENIAFGIPKEKINLDKVKKAANMAKISSFIESSSKGYQTFVGEAGVKLSGGQRQRIGIARALYKNTELIILDEATSSLDFKTEKEIMESIKKLSKDKTVIIVAHRFSTLEFCDQIIDLKKYS